MRHLCLIAALLLYGIGAARDGVDRWVAATVLPPLIAETSVEVRDRNGDLLRAYTVADGRWRLRVSNSAVDPDFIKMLVRFEDKRFWRHHGVDYYAVARAIGQAIWHGEVVSGGSTLTMQVARLLEDGGTGSWAGKLRQVRVALALERRLSKDEILNLYLNRAPYGGNIEGIRAATLAYFGKPPHRLTPAEIALLVALPQSPETRRPDREIANAYLARDRVLGRMVLAEMLDEREADAAKTESIKAIRVPLPQIAAHLTDRARSDDPLLDRYELTIDAMLQSSLEAMAARAATQAGERLSIAIVVADYRSGEVLASVGSAGFQADQRQGFVDMTAALRSPGSTLKPLIYGLAFDRGLVHPETLIADRPTDFGGYAPQNFDGLFRGELRVREALQLSLNIPAVALTERLGPLHLVAGLRRAGANPVVPGGRPGLAVALGGVGLTLEDLVRLYGTIARGGMAMPFHWVEGAELPLERRVMGEVAAWQVANILSGTPRPRGYASDILAFKTGTSYGYRDAWAVGFDGAHVIGVWLGRPDGTPVPGAFGGALAAPVLFSAFERLKPELERLPPPPAATLLLSGGELPLPLRRFRSLGERAVVQNAPRIAFPPDGSIIEGPDLIARVTEGQPPFIWIANGKPVGRANTRQINLPDLGAGFSDLMVIDAAGNAATVHFRLE